MIKNLIFKWVVFMSVTLFGFFVLHMFDMWSALWQADQTKLSFFILAVWLVSSISALLYILKPKLVSLDILWFSGESMITLGLIGTVCGFLIMLFTAFANIDVSSTESLQDALAFMAMGMSTALSTTLVGLVSSLHLKTQLVLLETADNGQKQV
jgi:hypothetical protein